ncbi:MAG: hypothetical protein RIS80_473 [Actinomycetota bacterium]
MTKPQTVGLLGAVAIGLASMLGAGVFSVFGLAYGKTQGGFFTALLLAALVASLNAASVYALATRVDRPGGIYAYSREFVGPTTSFIAGFAFVLGKIGSIAAIAWIFGEYFLPTEHYLDAIGAIVLLTVLNILGINRTATVAAVLAVVVTGFLLVTGLSGVAASAGAPVATSVGGFSGILPAASLLFFAFAGYARVATLGNEVREAKRNIPRAIAISLSVVLAVYLLLSIALVRLVGGGLDHIDQPLAVLNAYVNPWMPGWLTPLVATLATLGSMLALLAGVSRTAATMAEDSELPKLLAKRNRFGAPWVAELLIAAAAISVFVFNDYLQWIVGFSSFSVLLYYAIGHISVLRLPTAERKALTAVAVGGLALCAALLLSVPGPAVWLSSLILVLALAIRQVVSRLRAR